MAPSEFRIGNLLCDVLTGELLKVCELSETSIVSKVIDRSKYPLPAGWKLSKIPLTEEWLLKLGFTMKEVPGCAPYYFLNNNEFEIGWALNEGIGICFSDNNCLTDFPHIKYAHQLQNIYFALTGKELKFK